MWEWKQEETMDGTMNHMKQMNWDDNKDEEDDDSRTSKIEHFLNYCLDNWTLWVISRIYILLFLLTWIQSSVTRKPAIFLTLYEGSYVRALIVTF